MLLPLLGATGGRLWPVYVVTAAQAVLQQLNDPASLALLPRVVTAEQLVAANAAAATGSSVPRLVGAPLGGIAVGLGGLDTVVLIDAVTTFLAVAVRRRAPRRGPEQPLVRLRTQGSSVHRYLPVHQPPEAIATTTSIVSTQHREAFCDVERRGRPAGGRDTVFAGRCGPSHRTSSGWPTTISLVDPRGGRLWRHRGRCGLCSVGEVPKVIYAYLASLDGFIADDAGQFDWAVPDEEVLDFINETERGIGTYLYGRKIYEMMIGWETDPALAAQSTKSEEFARIWQQADKIVFSRTLDEVSTKRTRVERDFDPQLVREIKASVDHDLAVSGAELAATAWRAGLVDEVHVFITPILVGGGQRMFPDGVRQSLDLVQERRFGNGMVFARYAVVR